MEKMGVKFIKECVPLKIEANAERKQVHYKQTKGDETGIFECDTVLFAIGRIARTLELELPNAGVQVKENGKLRVNEKDQTNVQNIYAIGDVVFGILELTPVAIKSGIFAFGFFFFGICGWVNVERVLFFGFSFFFGFFYFGFF